MALPLLLVAACDGRKADVPQEAKAEQALAKSGKLDRSHAGQPAPDLEFLDPEGEKVALASFSGKPLLLNLWATWCAPCVAEMPTLDALAARAPDLQVLAVSQDIEGQEAKVATFFEERKLTRLDPYRDTEIGLMTGLKADVLPTTILYDSTGKEVWRMTGAADWTGAEAAKLLAEAQ
ncbi:MAG TPA: TlpA disulfide reductase family protein [Allosphingosinicella sp.]|nr:TlpA disulfide reductase family protein [Allosphingosinicella sp.]